MKTFFGVEIANSYLNQNINDLVNQIKEEFQKEKSARNILSEKYSEAVKVLAQTKMELERALKGQKPLHQAAIESVDAIRAITPYLNYSTMKNMTDQPYSDEEKTNIMDKFK